MSFDQYGEIIGLLIFFFSRKLVKACSGLVVIIFETIRRYTTTGHVFKVNVNRFRSTGLSDYYTGTAVASNRWATAEVWYELRCFVVSNVVRKTITLTTIRRPSEIRISGVQDPSLRSAAPGYGLGQQCNIVLLVISKRRRVVAVFKKRKRLKNDFEWCSGFFVHRLEIAREN